jgi:hypothetical protein
LEHFANGTTLLATENATFANQDTSLVILSFVSPFARWYSLLIGGDQPTNCPITTWSLANYYCLPTTVAEQ